MKCQRWRRPVHLVERSLLAVASRLAAHEDHEPHDHEQDDKADRDEGQVVQEENQQERWQVESHLGQFTSAAGGSGVRNGYLSRATDPKDG